MARRKPARPGVRAGDVFTAKARRGWHRLRVRAVKGMKTPWPYALLQEIDKLGKPMAGRDRNGMPRREPFVSMLVWRDGGWYLNGFYQQEGK